MLQYCKASTAGARDISVRFPKMQCPHIILYLTSDSIRHTSVWTVLQNRTLLHKGPVKHSRWCPHQEQRSLAQASDGQIVSCHMPFPLHNHQRGTTVWVTAYPLSLRISHLSKREVSCRPCKGWSWGMFKPHTSIPGKFWPNYPSGPQPISNFSSFLYLALSLIHWTWAEGKVYCWHTCTQLYFKETKILQPPHATFLSLPSVIPISHIRKVTCYD